MARKVLLLGDSHFEVLVLTSRHLKKAWPAELREALASCARRGLRVKVLVEGPSRISLLPELPDAGAEVRYSRTGFLWRTSPSSVQPEMWIFDRRELAAGNETRLPRENFGQAMSAEFLWGRDAARGMATYFDERWNSTSRIPLAFSVRQKHFSFHSGHGSAHEFYACLLRAERSIVLCSPEGRISGRVARALEASLRNGVEVTVYANADREDAYALKRLRRLAGMGAKVKICGRRLVSSLAIVDETFIYIGPLPPPGLFGNKGCTAFIAQDRQTGLEILQSLEKQVSIEFGGAPALP